MTAVRSRLKARIHGWREKSLLCHAVCFRYSAPIAPCQGLIEQLWSLVPVALHIERKWNITKGLLKADGPFIRQNFKLLFPSRHTQDK